MAAKSTVWMVRSTTRTPKRTDNVKTLIGLKLFHPVSLTFKFQEAQFEEVFVILRTLNELNFDGSPKDRPAWLRKPFLSSCARPRGQLPEHHKLIIPKDNLFILDHSPAHPYRGVKHSLSYVPGISLSPIHLLLKSR